jgi:hypothetical protein
MFYHIQNEMGLNEWYLGSLVVLKPFSNNIGIGKNCRWMIVK